jgi:hypothetical protein
VSTDRKPSALDAINFIQLKDPVQMPGGLVLSSWSRNKDALRLELTESPRPGRLRFWGLRDKERSGDFVDVPMTQIAYEIGRIEPAKA